ncbi:gas vesicle protein GvpO [Streptomyces rugosispiralis]|uniref:Gas vesicle protein n=1 Tax=Streptomyces rugosispiralis TaxID=2967341 RepID=A0ABT1V6I6_9ACTN|nr:gas vesicle protein [Streptomyces rugosispiralis]MCQ8193000.1 gas vesicle protein [Streptomyces rugosispiralis]
MTSIEPDTPATGTSETSDARPRRVPVAQAMRGAARQLGELLGTTPEAVSAMRPTPDGWVADVEVVELERVPETMTIMATYRVTLDSQGQLLGYERQHRYARGRLDHGR